MGIKVCLMHYAIIVSLSLFIGSESFAGEVVQYNRESQKSDGTLIVGLECNKRNNILQLGFFDAYNVPKKNMDLWDTFDLKKNNASGDAVVRVLSVVRGCKLGGVRYRIKITGEPANWNLNGECGSLTFATAKVWRDERLIFDEAVSDCVSWPRLRTITFSPINEAPLKREGSSLSELHLY
jgi:hypothetical protein